MNQLFNVSHRDNVLAPPTWPFDLSVYDLFGSWLAGASVTSYRRTTTSRQHGYMRYASGKSGSGTSVPAILQMLVQYCAQENILSLPQLRHIWLSGDRISAADRRSTSALPQRHHHQPWRCHRRGNMVNLSSTYTRYALQKRHPLWNRIAESKHVGVE